MKVPWSRDINDVVETINVLVDTDVPLYLQFNGGEPKLSKALKIHIHNGVSYLLLKRPADMLEPGRDINSVIYKLNGLPVLGFNLSIVKESGKLLGAMLPTEIFQIDLREHPRFKTPSGSMASFLLNNRGRVSLCRLVDISENGARLIGSPVYQVGEKQTIGPCTLSLTGSQGIIAREITIQRAKIVRTMPIKNKDKTLELGLNFELTDFERERLQENVEFIARQR